MENSPDPIAKQITTSESPEKKNSITGLDDSKVSINLFKSLKVPNLETVIQHSHEIVSDLFGYAGDLWKKASYTVKVKELKTEESQDSSVIYEEPSSEIIIFQRQSTHVANKNMSIQKKSIKNSKSFMYVPQRLSQLQVDEDIQPRIANIRNNSVIESKRRGFNSQIHLFNLTGQDSFDLQARNSLGTKENYSLIKSPEIIPEKFEDFDGNKDLECLNSALKTQFCEENSRETSENFEIGEDSQRKMLAPSSPQSKHTKSSTSCFLAIPQMFKVRHNSECLVPDAVKNFCIDEDRVETSPIAHEEQKIMSFTLESPISRVNSSLSSRNSIYNIIPKSIMYQIPVLSFDELISGLISNEMARSQVNPRIWNTGFWTNLKYKCCRSNVSDEDHVVCEKIIIFSLENFNFKNSFHLILLLSCFTSVTGNDTWPHKDDEWYEMGFNSNDIKSELENKGNITLLNIFFMSTYFPKFFEEMLQVRRYFLFDLYDVISAFSVFTVEMIRKKKLHGLIKRYGRGLEVIFFYFAGILIFWFKELVKCKEFNLVYDITLEKAQSSMEELLQNAWSHYIDRA